MLYPVEKLIEGRGKPLCVRQDETVRDALVQMVENNYSQLPIVDAGGRLAGIISEQSISRTYYHLGDDVSVLDLKVTACSDRPATVPIDRDIFDVLDRLQRSDAVVIIENEEPVGILTTHDTTSFFRSVSEGFIIVEDIEVTLRQLIDETLPTDEERRRAMQNAFRHLMKSEDARAPEYERMSFGDYINLIVNGKNWEQFKSRFESRPLFHRYMNQVRDIRNQLAHFRGQLDAVQQDVLTRALAWLDSRRQPVATSSAAAFASGAMIAEPQAQYGADVRDGKYSPLEGFLAGLQDTTGLLRVSFSDIESLLAEPLPESARKHRAWWSNDPTSGRQSNAWMRAGWKVEDVDFSAEAVAFRRTDSVLYQLFFADLLERLKETRPGLTRAKRTYPQNWWNFSGGRSGFYFGWAFGAEGEFRVELYIDTGDKETTKQAFDSLQQQREEIEREVGAKLNWHRMDDARASRIYHSRPASVAAAPEAVEELKQWALESLLALVDALQPRVRQLHLSEPSAD